MDGIAGMPVSRKCEKAVFAGCSSQEMAFHPEKGYYPKPRGFGTQVKLVIENNFHGSKA